MLTNNNNNKSNDTVLLLFLFIGSLIASIAVPIYSINNLIKISELEKLEKEYEVAEITNIYNPQRRHNNRSFVYNFKIANDEKIYRKNISGRPKEDKILYVKFNDDKTFWIVKDHIEEDYKGNKTLLIFGGIFIIITIALFIAIKDKFKNIIWRKK